MTQGIVANPLDDLSAQTQWQNQLCLVAKTDVLHCKPVQQNLLSCASHIITN